MITIEERIKIYRDFFDNIELPRQWNVQIRDVEYVEYSGKILCFLCMNSISTYLKIEVKIPPNDEKITKKEWLDILKKETKKVCEVIKRKGLEGKGPFYNEIRVGNGVIRLRKNKEKQ